MTGERGKRKKERIKERSNEGGRENEEERERQRGMRHKAPLQHHHLPKADILRTINNVYAGKTAVASKTCVISFALLGRYGNGRV